MSLADSTQLLKKYASLLPEKRSDLSTKFTSNNPMCGDTISYFGKENLFHLETESCLICQATAGLLWRDRTEFELISPLKDNFNDQTKNIWNNDLGENFQFLEESKRWDWLKLIEILREIPSRGKCFLLPIQGFHSYIQKRGLNDSH